MRTPAEDLSRYFRKEVEEKAKVQYEENDLIRLHHRYDAVCEVIEFVCNCTRSDSNTDRLLVLSLTKDIPADFGKENCLTKKWRAWRESNPQPTD